MKDVSKSNELKVKGEFELNTGKIMHITINVDGSWLNSCLEAVRDFLLRSQSQTEAKVLQCGVNLLSVLRQNQTL